MKSFLDSFGEEVSSFKLDRQSLKDNGAPVGFTKR